MKKSLIGISILSVLVLAFLIKSQTSEPEPVQWQLFESQRSHMKLIFTMDYPSLWVHPGAIAGGQFVYETFYLENKYREDCRDNNDGSSSCVKSGKVAEIMITPRIESTITYDNEIRKNITIDGFQGILIVGNVKVNSDPRLYIAKENEKEMRIIIPDVYGDNFELYMQIANSEDELVFLRMIESINFIERLTY